MVQTAQLMSAAAALHATALDTPLTRSQINTTMDGALPKWHWRTAYDAIETATAMRFIAEGPGAVRHGPVAVFDLAHRLQRWAPTQTLRSEESAARELFSTPPVVSAGLALMLRISKGSRLLEPSAGNGGLAAPAAAFGCELWLNEPDAGSRAVLEQTFPTAQLSDVDATVLHALTAPTGPFDHVMLNPPFRPANRHLSAAFRALAPGGTLAAVLPARFRDPSVLAKALGSEAAVDVHWTLGPKCFAHAGVSTDTTVVVARRGIGPRATGPAMIEDLDAFTAAVLSYLGSAAPAARPASTTARIPAPKIATLAAPRSRRSGPANRTDFQPPLPGVPLAIGEYQPGSPEAAGDSPIYARYRPSRLRIAAAKEHIDPLVETMSMASVPMPTPTYQPHLPERLVSSGALSLAQLETVVYAGQAHERLIPGEYVPNDAGTDLVQNEEGEQYRYGFFLADGTGVGKGRQISGILLDNLCQGRTKALWLSESADLIEDARRDWTALGGKRSDIIDLKSIPADVNISDRNGIFFATYATARRQATQTTRAREDQIVEAFGEDFDGVIVFDEAHAMGSATDCEGPLGVQKGSLTGRFGLRIQNRLPNARVVYASATGGSEVRNIAYASRLGLWGCPQTPFTGRDECISNLSSGGPAALELLMRELKGRGLYLARSLSFEGVEFEPLVHELTPADKAVWDKWSEAWTLIHTNLHDALESTGVTGEEGKTVAKNAKAAALSAFESTKLRFFGHLLQSLTAPAVIEQLEADIAAGLAPVIQITSTNEAILDRRLKQAGDVSVEDLDFTPKEYVLDYLDRAFPTIMYVPVPGDSGEPVGAEPMTDSDGNYVVCPDALRAKDQLMEHLVLMPECLGALDQLVRHFGTTRLAECTGRTRRIVSIEGRRAVDRRGANANRHDAARFMAGDADLLVFSQAGGTGASYHASRDCQNQKRRKHYLLEPGWRASTAIQGVGRTHRNNQASAPIVCVASTDLAGQKRFISTISRRLETLGAFTRADRRSAGEQLFSPLDNLEGFLPLSAYQSWCILMARGDSCISTTDFQRLTGLTLIQEGQLVSDLPKITRWLNRILALPVDTQNAIFAEFFELLENAHERAEKEGTLNREIAAIRADHIRLLERHTLAPDEHAFLPAFVSVYETVTRPKLRPFDSLPTSPAEVDGYFFDRQKYMPILVTTPRLAAGTDGQPYQIVTCMTPHSTYHAALTSISLNRLEEIPADEFEGLWRELERQPLRPEKKLLHVLHGACLHLWKTLPATDLAVRRIRLDDGETVIGRVIEPEMASRLAQITTKPSPANIIAHLRSDRAELRDDATNLRLWVGRFMDKQVLQIGGFDRSQADFWKGLGAGLSIHNYQPRLTVPLDEAEAFIERLLAARPDLSFR